MPAVAAVARRCGRAFSGAVAARVVAEWEGGRDRLPRPPGYRAVMIARMQTCGRHGRGGSRSSVREIFTYS
jgi:hypothetical protein